MSWADTIPWQGSTGQSQVADQEHVQPAPSEQPLVLPEASQQAEQEEEDSTYQEPAPEDLLAPPDFRSFFTLIEDPATGEYHHPNVHYLFADDDAELLTNAALDVIATGQAVGAGEHLDQEERIVVLDMTPDGKEVASATSLSPHWQTLKTTVVQAPSWGGDASAVERGLLLKVSGQEARSVWSLTEAGTSDGLDDLARAFDERLRRLDEIMGHVVEEAVDQKPSSDKRGTI